MEDTKPINQAKLKQLINNAIKSDHDWALLPTKSADELGMKVFKYAKLDALLMFFDASRTISKAALLAYMALREEHRYQGHEFPEGDKLVASIERVINTIDQKASDLYG